MELINATRMTAGYNMGPEPSGRELLMVVIKGTFVLPKPGEQVRLHDVKLPPTPTEAASSTIGAPVENLVSGFPEKQHRPAKFTQLDCSPVANWIVRNRYAVEYMRHTNSGAA